MTEAERARWDCVQEFRADGTQQPRWLHRDADNLVAPWIELDPRVVLNAAGRHAPASGQAGGPGSVGQHSGELRERQGDDLTGLGPRRPPPSGSCLMTAGPSGVRATARQAVGDSLRHGWC